MKRRFHNLSIYRIIATILVIQFHIFFLFNTYQLHGEYLFSKLVQGLTALSGFLYSQKLIKDVKSFYLGNLKKIAIPALLVLGFMAIWNVVYMFVNKDYNYFSLFTAVRPFNNSSLVIFGNFYYLAYILLCYLITPLLQRNDKYSKLAVVGVVLFEVLLAYFFNSAYIAIAYVIGYYVGKKSFNDYVDPSTKYSFKKIIFWFLILAISTATFFLTHYYRFEDVYLLNRLIMVYHCFIGALFGVATFFLFSYIFKFVNKYTKGIKFLSYTDKLSYVLYLFNQCFMVGTTNVSIFSNNLFVQYLLMYGFTFVASIFIQFIYDLIFNKKKAKVSTNGN